MTRFLYLIRRFVFVATMFGDDVCIAFTRHLNTKIPTKTHHFVRLRGFLKFYRYSLPCAVRIFNDTSKVNTEKLQLIVALISMVMSLNINVNNLLVENATKKHFGRPLIFHQILKNSVVYRITNFCHNIFSFMTTKIKKTLDISN